MRTTSDRLPATQRQSLVRTLAVNALIEDEILRKLVYAEHCVDTTEMVRTADPTHWHNPNTETRTCQPQASESFSESSG